MYGTFNRVYRVMYTNFVNATFVSVKKITVTKLNEEWEPFQIAC